MPKRITSRVLRAIEEGVFPGCVIGIVKADGERVVQPFGKHTYHESGKDVSANTIYDIASITKSVPTASLALSLIREGKLHLTDLVRDHIKELKNDHDATIEDLLRYRVRGVQMSSLKGMDVANLRIHVLERGFIGARGERQYTNLPAYFLGNIVESLMERPLDDAAAEHFFAPLGMYRTFFLEPFPKHECAPTEIQDGREIHAIPHDESARMLAKGNVAAGHAGLFSTALDILNFLEALLQDWNPAIAEGAEQGLGWQVNEPYFMGARASEKTFGKTGFTGTSVIADRERGIAFVILSNRTYPTRPQSDDAINSFRRDIANHIFSQIE